jgi:methionyl-tRNA synthetase
MGGVELPTITIDDFAKMELRVARVLSAEPHPDADKLIVMQIDLGDEQRQIVAGLREWYAPEDLAGKSIVVVANLQPAVLRGVESNGMLLAAQGDGTVVILSPEKDLPPGSRVR